MKKNLLCLFLALVIALSAFGIVAAQTEEVTIDLGTSEIYSEADMDSAIAVILDEFNTWEGCEMHFIGYAGDDESTGILDLLNALDRGVFDEAIIFNTWFRSPKEEYGAWQADKEYTWSWYLGRADKGDWQLLDWGWTEDYFKSEQYTDEEMFDAMDVIYAKLDSFEGVEPHYLKYAGDEFSNQELNDYINTMDWGTFDEAAVFFSCFQSPKEESGAWEPDTVYTWSWYLGRVDKGDWQLLTYGY